MKHSRVIYIMGILGLAALIIILNFTSPTKIGPSGVLLFFTTLYITIFSVIILFVQLFNRFAFKRNTLRRKDYLYSTILAFGPIMLLIARSFSAISLWTIALIISFLCLALFLVAKRA